MSKERIGILDIGSNSLRLVIYEKHTKSYIKEILNLKIPARLISYIKNDGTLSDTGIRKLLELLKQIHSVLSDFNLNILKATATAVLRNAKNRDEIEKAIKEQNIIPVTILSEQEEAYYGFLAVITSTNIKSGITIDIGGGSTEITLFQDREMFSYHSFPFGSLTLKDFFKKDPPAFEDLRKLKEFLIYQYDSLNWLSTSSLPVIGIGGSARTIGKIHQQSCQFSSMGLHQYEMTLTEVNKVCDTLTSKSIKERTKIKGLSKERADSITPAAIAIQQLIQVTKSQKYVVSKKGLREGLLTEILLQRT